MQFFIAPLEFFRPAFSNNLSLAHSIVNCLSEILMDILHNNKITIKSNSFMSLNSANERIVFCTKC